MSDLSGKAIRSITDSLMSSAKTTHGLWEEIAKYMKPQRLGLETQFSPGGDLTQYVYDSTALVASKDWVDATHFALANPFISFVGMEVATPNDDEVPAPVTDWCQDSAKTMLKHLRDSNFTASMNEALNDIGLFGNTSMQVHEMPGDKFELAFEALHLRDVVPLIGAFGRIQATFYRCKLTAQAMAEQFAPDEYGAEDMEGLEDKIGKRAYKAIKEDKPYVEIDCIHAVFPRKKADIKVNETTGLAEPEDRPFASIWITDDIETKALKVGGYYEQPRFWARFRRRTDDPMGGGIGEIALPDTYSANEYDRQMHNAGDKEIDPPYFSESEQVVGDLDTRARGITIVNDIDKIRQEPIRASSIGQNHYQLKRESIRDIWMADEIKLPPREKVGHMTAYEVSKRIERIYQLMGPELDRIHNELLRPLLERVFGILKRAGKLEEMPEEMRELAAEGATLEFKFLGPAVRSQQGEEVAALDDHLAYLLSVEEKAPGTVDAVDIDAHLKKRAELIGYPMDLYRSKDEIKALRDDRAKQQAAMQAAQTAKDMGSAAKSLTGSEAGLELLQGGQGQ